MEVPRHKVTVPDWPVGREARIQAPAVQLNKNRKKEREGGKEKRKKMKDIQVRRKTLFADDMILLVKLPRNLTHTQTCTHTH